MLSLPHRAVVERDAFTAGLRSRYEVLYPAMPCRFDRYNRTVIVPGKLGLRVTDRITRITTVDGTIRGVHFRIGNIQPGQRRFRLLELLGGSTNRLFFATAVHGHGVSGRPRTSGSLA